VTLVLRLEALHLRHVLPHLARRVELAPDERHGAEAHEHGQPDDGKPPAEAD